MVAARENLKQQQTCSHVHVPRRRRASNVQCVRPVLVATLASWLFGSAWSHRTTFDLNFTKTEDWIFARQRSLLARMEERTNEDPISASSKGTEQQQREKRTDSVQEEPNKKERDEASEKPKEENTNVVPDGEQQSDREQVTEQETDKATKKTADKVMDKTEDKVMSESRENQRSPKNQPAWDEVDAEPLKVSTWNLQSSGLANPFAYYIEIDPEDYARREKPMSWFWKTVVDPSLKRWEDWLYPAEDGQIPQLVHFMEPSEAVDLVHNHKALLQGMEKLLAPPQDGQQRSASDPHSTKVSEVFTEKMLAELLDVMERSGAISGFDSDARDKLQSMWATRFGRGDKGVRDMTIAEFVLSDEIQNSDIIAVADELTNAMADQWGHYYFRPSLMTAYERSVGNLTAWWSQWMDFMFHQKRSFIPNSGGRTQMEGSENNAVQYITTSVVGTMTAKAFTFSPEFERTWYTKGSWKRRLRAIWNRCAGAGPGLSTQELKVCAASDAQIIQFLGIHGDMDKKYFLGTDQNGNEIVFTWHTFQEWAKEKRFGNGPAPPDTNDAEDEKAHHDVSENSLEAGRTYWSNGYRYTKDFESCYEHTGESCLPDGTCPLSVGDTDRVVCDNETKSCRCRKHFCAKQGRCEPDGTSEAPSCDKETGAKCKISACDATRGALCQDGKCVCAWGCSIGAGCFLQNPHGWCQNGIPDVSGTACCPRRCRRCESNNCRQRNGTMNECCPGRIRQGRMCSDAMDIMCVIPSKPTDYYSVSGLVRAEEVANLGASILGLAVWDAAYIHMMTSILEESILHKTRLDLVEQVVETRSAKAMKVLEEQYHRQDVIFLQGMKVRAFNETMQNTLSVHFHVLSPAAWDSSNANEETAVILINKKVFVHERAVQDLSPWVYQMLMDVDTKVYGLLPKGALFVVKVNLFTEGEYLLASIALQSSAAAVSVMSAVYGALTRLGLDEIPLVVGIHTDMQATTTEKWTLDQFQQELARARSTLITAYLDKTLNYTPRAVKHGWLTLMQPKPGHAKSAANHDAENQSSPMPAHHVLFDSKCFKAMSIDEDNTGHREYSASALLPSIDMPLTTPILEAKLQPLSGCAWGKKTVKASTGEGLWAYEMAVVAATVVGVPALILAGTQVRL